MITRTLIQIMVGFADDGTPSVLASAVVQDDSEGTASSTVKPMNNSAVKTAATALRDAVIAVAANAGKPVVAGRVVP